jgi:hypothetical protein
LALQSDGRLLYLWSRSNPPQVKLDPGSTWSIFIHPMYGYCLKPEAQIELPKKLYGDTVSDTELYLDRWKTWDRRKQLAIFLSGRAGSGKTLQAKHTAVCSGLPIIFVNQDHANRAFVDFIVKAIDAPVCLIFDEFEKVYSKKESQEFLLTVLDGTLALPNVLMLMTSNTQNINEYMKNRPGRIYYTRDYSGVSPEFIKEYCEDRGLSAARIKDILKLASRHDEGFNFDSLQAIVSECLFDDFRVEKYGRKPRSFPATVSFMNVAGSSRGAGGYTGKVQGPLADLFNSASIVVRTRSPMNILNCGDNFNLSITKDTGGKFFPCVESWTTITVMPADLVSYDKTEDSFILSIDLGQKLNIGRSVKDLLYSGGFNVLLNAIKTRMRSIPSVNDEDYDDDENEVLDEENLSDEDKKTRLLNSDFERTHFACPWLLAYHMKLSGEKKLSTFAHAELLSIRAFMDMVRSIVPEFFEELEHAARTPGDYTLPSLRLTIAFQPADGTLVEKSAYNTFIQQGF